MQQRSMKHCPTSLYYKQIRSHKYSTETRGTCMQCLINVTVNGAWTAQFSYSPMKQFKNKIPLLQTPGQLTMMQCSVLYIQSQMEPNFTMHHECCNVSYSYYCSFYRCQVAVTINEHQWEVAAETFSCFVCYWTHSSAGPLASQWSCPPPDTCKATVGQDQMGGGEIVGGASVSSVVLSTEGSLCCAMSLQQFRHQTQGT